MNPPYYVGLNSKVKDLGISDHGPPSFWGVNMYH